MLDSVRACKLFYDVVLSTTIIIFEIKLNANAVFNEE